MPVLCNVHPDMAGYLIVSPTPYFAETDDSGNYKIKDVPDGSYNRDGVARRRQRPVQTGYCCGRRQSGFHPDEVRRQRVEQGSVRSLPVLFLHSQPN